MPSSAAGLVTGCARTPEATGARRDVPRMSVSAPQVDPHGLDPVLAAAMHGTGPPADFETSLLPRPPGPVSAVLAFTGHHVVAADVDRRWLDDALGADFAAAHRAPFLMALGARIDARPGHLDLVLALRPGAERPVAAHEVELEPLPIAGVPHPRLTRAQDYRTDVTAWETADGRGLLTIGRGLAGRWEVSFEVTPLARGRGLGRALAAAARRFVPPDQPVYAQVSPGNVASVRAVLGAGYAPIGAEVLYHHSRHRACSEQSHLPRAVR